MEALIFVLGSALIIYISRKSLAFATVAWVLPLLCMGMYSGLVFAQREILVCRAIRVESTHRVDFALCIIDPAWLRSSLPAHAGKAD